MISDSWLWHEVCFTIGCTKLHFVRLIIMSSLFLPIITIIQLLGLPDVQADDVVRVAQAAEVDKSQVASNQAVNRLAAFQKKERALKLEKSKLRSTYNKQLAEVDKLKRARASWRRDRKLREQKATSQKTAIALQALDRKLRSQAVLVSKARTALAKAIDQEINLGPTLARRAYLKSMLGKVRSGLRKAPKKITMPDLELDEFADPEELIEQIALIERAEAKLARQEKSLARRAQHYNHMEVLRSKRQRANELGVFDNDDVRNSGGRANSKSRGSNADLEASSPDPSSGGAQSDGFTDSGAPPPGESPTGVGETSSLEISSVVLADVVDAGTQDALRRAHRSTSPRTKAVAAKRAHAQVSDRLARLRASKARIRRHLKRNKR